MNKLCKDCKNFYPDTLCWSGKDYQAKYAICALTSKVTGLDGKRCIDRRNGFFDSCGSRGKQWEAKP